MTRTDPLRPLCAPPGKRTHRYTPAHQTDIRRTFRRARLLAYLQRNRSTTP